MGGYQDLRVPLGKSIGDGWIPLVEELIAKLDNEYPGWRCAQIKEKFGTLRFYADPPDDLDDDDEREAFWKAIDEAERKSAMLCEVCGSPGKVRNAKADGGWAWVKTLCTQHAVLGGYRLGVLIPKRP